MRKGYGTSKLNESISDSLKDLIIESRKFEKLLFKDDGPFQNGNNDYYGDDENRKKKSIIKLKLKQIDFEGNE
jgi:hypothetical protein